MLASTRLAPQGAWQQRIEAALERGRNGDTRGGLIALQQCIEAARLAGDKRGEITALNGAALMQSIRGDFWASLAGSIDAFFMARKHGDRPGMAHAMAMLAGALLLMTPLDREIGLLREALAIAEEERDIRLQIRIHNLLGILQGDLARFDEAGMHLDLALVLAESDHSGFDRWRLMANIANLQRKRAQQAHDRNAPVNCSEHCARGLELIGRVEVHCREHGKVPILLDSLRIAGMLHALQARPELAYARYAAAWTLATHNRQRTALPALGLELGRLALASGRLNSAENTLAQALQEAAQNRPSPKAAELNETMAAVQRARGERRGEAHWLKEAADSRRDFEALKIEARRQIDRVAESVLAEAVL
ncbi:MAG: hypothetical protein ABI790_10850 [Betaproteobacteria bacterium]